MTTPYSSIGEIEALVRSLADADRELFRFLYDLRLEGAFTLPPPSMEPWIRNQFGSVETVRTQSIVKVINSVTLEGALFNPLRELRPHHQRGGLPAPRSAWDVGDPLAAPLHNTPEDPFGWVRGRHAVTASNVAKADLFHAVMVFDEPNPLAFDQ